MVRFNINEFEHKNYIYPVNCSRLLRSSAAGLYDQNMNLLTSLKFLLVPCCCSKISSRSCICDGCCLKIRQIDISATLWHCHGQRV